MFSDNDTPLSYNSFVTAKRLDEILKIFIPILTEIKLRTYAEAVVQRYSVKKVFLEISQNSQENSCARVSFLIVVGLRAASLLRKRLYHRCFPVNFVKFVRTLFFTEHLW